MAIRVGRFNERGAVYIGRPSPLGNPFKIGRDGTRDEVCDKYAAWLREQVASNNEGVVSELRRLYRLARQQDIVLGCYCAPARCHGDSIKAFLEEHLPD